MRRLTGLTPAEKKFLDDAVAEAERAEVRQEAEFTWSKPKPFRR